MPTTISLVSGSAKKTQVVLSLRNGSGPVVECSYDPGTPRHGWDVDFYELKRCSNAVRAGDAVQTDALGLHIELQGQKQVEAAVTVTLAE